MGQFGPLIWKFCMVAKGWMLSLMGDRALFWSIGGLENNFVLEQWKYYPLVTKATQKLFKKLFWGNLGHLCEVQYGGQGITHPSKTGTCTCAVCFFEEDWTRPCNLCILRVQIFSNGRSGIVLVRWRFMEKHWLWNWNSAAKGMCDFPNPCFLNIL